MKVKITRKTFTAVDLARIGPRALGHWNLICTNGLHIVELDDDVCKELVKRGARLDDPKSIERVVLEALKDA